MIYNIVTNNNNKSTIMKKILLFTLSVIISLSAFAESITSIKSGFNWADKTGNFYETSSNGLDVRGTDRQVYIFFNVESGTDVSADAIELALKVHANTSATSLSLYGVDYLSSDANPTWDEFGDISTNTTATDLRTLETVDLTGAQSGDIVRFSSTTFKNYVIEKINASRTELCFVLALPEALTESDEIKFHSNKSSSFDTPPSLNFISGATATVSGARDFYLGEEVDLTVEITDGSGAGDYVVTYNVDGGGSQTETSTNSTLTISLTPSATSVVNIESITDNGNPVTLIGGSDYTFTLVERSFKTTCMSSVVTSGNSYTYTFSQKGVYPFEVTINGSVNTFNEGDDLSIVLDLSDNTKYVVNSVKDAYVTYTGDELSNVDVVVGVDKGSATTQAVSVDTYIESGDNKATDYKDYGSGVDEIGHLLSKLGSDTGEDSSEKNRAIFLNFDISGISGSAGTILLGMDYVSNSNGGYVAHIGAIEGDDLTSDVTYVTHGTHLQTPPTTIAESYVATVDWANDVASATNHKMVYFDVTDYVKGKIGSATNITFVVNADTEGRFTRYVSTEGVSQNSELTLSAPYLWIDASTTTDIEDGIEEEKVVFYPNPATTVVNFVEQVASVKIYNISGKLVKAAQDVETLSIDELINGLYVIELTTVEGKVSVQKLMVK